jgi:hypothetical protein
MFSCYQRIDEGAVLWTTREIISVTYLYVGGIGRRVRREERQRRIDEGAVLWTTKERRGEARGGRGGSMRGPCCGQRRKGERRGEGR